MRNYKVDEMTEEDVFNAIWRLRCFIMVSASLYYKYDTMLVSDAEYDMRSKLLVELQTKFPQIAEQCCFAEEFAEYDGSTSFYLADNEWGNQRALKLRRQGLCIK